MAPTIRGYQEYDGGERRNARRRGRLRSRKPAEPACAAGHEPCADTVHLRERGRDGRRDRRDHGGRERGGSGGAYAGRVEAARERVRAECGDRRKLGCDTTETEQPQERERTCGNGPHLEAVDGEAVIEAGCAKAHEQRVVETLRTPEHDRLDDGAPRPARPERGVTGEPALQPVADAAYAGPAAGGAPLLHPP